ncbi:helix-turn-helix domain-containing protein [Acidipropionibacterium acidipropionici]|uniref:helix-turn-helix domain-containing protein n=1 Tax=Acidipropionibacterium acidipropionici TaxID=1748 RepID=UPI00040F338A|nr:helix-turn-helix domain-containing protein [Acidipropionibacterium acidipropionici]ALN14338.1 hypothetical protein ASQ49_02605 [Acidipropionibacterium acidipropionici]APZ09899.1 DNA-binding protein [Acidipropionibacterium acidipropionici]
MSTASTTRTQAPQVGPDGLLERVFKVSELAAAGYGDKSSLTRRIHRGQLPAFRVGNAFRIRESDLRYLVDPVDPGPDDADDEAA